MTDHTDSNEKIDESGHVSVLLQESIDGLDLHSGDIFIDGTLGSGGHSEEVVKRFGDSVKIIGIDQDQDALTRAETRLGKLHADVVYIQGNFRNIDTILESLGFEHANKILLDIGLSSNQFETSGRGFSFKKDEPLVMTFKKDPQEEDLTAATIVNEWGEDTLEIILRGFGEERYSKKIAHAIVEYREHAPITTTQELVDIIVSATPRSYHHKKINPATKTFQALRIAVNDELGSLQKGLENSFKCLAPGGRIAVISFHSLEDRIVKNFFRDKHTAGEAILITKKPLVPQEEEISRNKRARSAKLRILEKRNYK